MQSRYRMADTVRQGLLGMQRLFLGSRTADLEASLRDMEDSVQG